MPKQSPRQPYETICHLLDYADIVYLSKLLYTIDTTRELRMKLIPQEVPSHTLESNFVRVEFKINALLRWYDPKVKLTAIAPPKKPMNYSRLMVRPQRKKSKPKP